MEYLGVCVACMIGLALLYLFSKFIFSCWICYKFCCFPCYDKKGKRKWKEPADEVYKEKPKELKKLKKKIAKTSKKDKSKKNDDPIVSMVEAQGESDYQSSTKS